MSTHYLIDIHDCANDTVVMFIIFSCVFLFYVIGRGAVEGRAQLCAKDSRRDVLCQATAGCYHRGSRSRSSNVLG